LADTDFEKMASALVSALQEATGETKKIKKETQGWAKALTDANSRWVKVSKLAQVQGKETGSAGKAFAQSWLAIRRISAKVSYDAYALQSTIVGFLDTMKSVTNTAEYFAKISSKTQEAQEIAGKSKIEQLEEQKKLLDENLKKGLEEAEQARKNAQEQLKFLQDKEEYNKKHGVGALTFEEASLKKTLEGQLKEGRYRGDAFDQAGANAVRDAIRGKAKLDADIDEEKRLEKQNRRMHNRVLAGYKKIFKVIKAEEIGKTIKSLGKMALIFIKFAAIFTLFGALLYLLDQRVDLVGILKVFFSAAKEIFTRVMDVITTLIWPALQKVVEGAFLTLEVINDILNGEIDTEKIMTALKTLFIEGLWPLLVGAFALVGAIVTCLFRGFYDGIVVYLEEQKERGIEALPAILGLVTAVVGIFIAVGYIASGLWIPAALTLLATVIVTALQQIILGEMATGGAVSRSGMYLVGERGPELVALPGNSRVYNNRETTAMSGGNNITVNVQGRIGASDSELREIAQKIGRMVNMEVNRTTASRTRGV
jgi:hypothetical protein